MRKVIQLAAIFLLLVVLPAGSWYYLQKGVNYRLETMGELKNHGPFTLLPTDTSVVENETISVINFLSLDEPSSAQQGELLAKLHDQFEKREDFRLVTFVDSLAASGLPAFKATYKLEEKNQCLFPSISKAEWTAFLGANSQLEGDLSQYLILVDLDGNIRNFYHQQELMEVRKLVEHIAFLLPIKKRDTAELRRETEK